MKINISMSKGAWVVVGWILLQGIVIWANNYKFLEHNVWLEQRAEVDQARLQTDLLRLAVAHLVEQSNVALFCGLLIPFVYLATQMKRIERRLTEMEERIAGEEPVTHIRSLIPDP